jgi:hypothetical protein
MSKPEPVKVEVREEVRTITVVSGKWIFVNSSKK